MAADWYINGETIARVKGPSGSAISALSVLGAGDSPIRVSPTIHRDPVHANPTGDVNTINEQIFGGEVFIHMTLVYFDSAIVDACEALANAGTTAGTLVRAGTLMATGARFAAGNNYIGLNLSSSVANRPFRFLTATLDTQPYEIPLGTGRSAIGLRWKAIPYVANPISGLAGTVLWDRTPDS